MASSMARWLRCCSALLLAAGVSACSSLEAELPAGGLRDRPDIQEQYGALQDERHAVRSVNLSRVDEKNLRQIVRFETQEEPGTIVIDTTQRFLYLVQDDGMALRYGIGVGKEGLEFTGSAIVGYKREWPRWTPTPDMIRRNPALYLPWQKGMEGGPTNPLGARALYLFKNGQDTLFRIHGTTEPWTIGTAASSGCIRMFNQDVIDLYGRVPRGAKVVVLGA
jgi:lipoprotein-anchoring transpeptidase ErfK/SrfK